MGVKQWCERFSVTGALTSLLQEFSISSDYRTLRDNLPGRLVELLACRDVLIYLSVGETLQLASGMFADKPGWSESLLAVAHINVLSLNSQGAEVRAWREKRVIWVPENEPTLMAVPLINRHQCIGVLVAQRGNGGERSGLPPYWSVSEVELLETVAGVVALLLENTRLRERDRERIQELSLLNSISSQLHRSLYEKERLHSVIIQRVREISAVDLCVLLETPAEPGQGYLSGDEPAWLTPALCDFLFRWCCEQHSLAPLLIARGALNDDPQSSACLEYLPASIKTFFVIPLLAGQISERQTYHLPDRSERGAEAPFPPLVRGIIVGGYYSARKLYDTELTLLKVLASQASTVLENMHLMAEVVEARNEARSLLRQVLDDRRLKELILESIPSGLITTDPQGRIQIFNRAAATILGYHPYEVLGQSLRKFLDIPLLATVPPTPVLVETLITRQESTATGGVPDRPARTRLAVSDRFERRRVLEVDTLPLYDEYGSSIGMLVSFSDMTAMQHLEEEKVRLDRLAALGEMAAGVAHEVRNPLASIKTSIQMLGDDLLQLPQDKEEEPCEGADLFDRGWMQESITVVLKEVERLDSIVRDLLLFSRPRQLHRVQCDVAHVCDQVCDLFQKRLVAANVVLHRIYEELPPVWLDRGQMEQALLNLLTNALQAMPDGGIITVTGRCVTRARPSPVWSVQRATSPPYASTTSTSSESFRHWLELVVSDTGNGMTPVQQERVFQPFYTTKAHGIGLGLPITRRLVEDHGGSIHIESQLGYGTTVMIHLPLVAGENAQE